MEFSPLAEDSTKCRMTFVIHLEVGELPHNNDPVMKSMEALIERFTIAHQSLFPGTFPPASSADIDTAAIPFIPVQSFAEREKLMISAMAHSVNNAIQKYLSGTLDAYNSLDAIRQQSCMEH